MSALKTAKMSNYRWVICTMLFFATTVNYLDRQVLSLTYPGNGGIQEEFGVMISMVPLLQSFPFSMLFACFSLENLLIGWAQRRAICGLSLSGVQVLCFMLSVVFLPLE